MPMNLPNLLTLSRIVAIPLVILTFFIDPPYGPWAGCVLFALAGFTDWLDGQLARRWHQQSAWGRVLDPIADKLLVATVLFMLVALNRMSAAAIFPALVILAREILVSGLREHLATLSVPLPVSRLAKWKTAIQMIAIGVLLVGDSGPSALHVRMIGELLLWIAAALTLVTGYDYLRAGMTHIGEEPAVVKEPKPHGVP
jgi:cardiolipin synthase (CMP-forming)